MRRGLDGFSRFLPRPSAVFKVHGAVSQAFGGEIARGKHLFPFRTEPLSLSAPMVLGGQPPGRVGRRRSSSSKEPPEGGSFFARIRGPSQFGSAREVRRHLAPRARST